MSVQRSWSSIRTALIPERAYVRQIVRARDAILFHPTVVRLINRVVVAVFKDRIRTRGCTIDTSGEIVQPWVKSLLVWGFYEKPEVLFVQRCLCPGLDVIELGGSIGVVSSHIAKKIDSGRRLISVEADPRLLDRIRQNLATNAPDASTYVVNAAVDYSTDGGDFVRLCLGETNLSGRLLNSSRAEQEVTVRRTTLRDLLHEHRVGQYTLVSDIEGAELGMLLNEQTALQKCRQLIIELHETDANGKHWAINDLIQLLELKHGFKLRDRLRSVYVFERESLPNAKHSNIAV